MRLRKRQQGAGHECADGCRHGLADGQHLWRGVTVRVSVRVAVSLVVGEEPGERHGSGQYTAVRQRVIDGGDEERLGHPEADAPHHHGSGSHARAVGR
ncbi:hypothetical protein [Streptomyces sp. NBC_01262]|uniref:hypothetical protein n=1 Tax=Streptomyces sp. NBC_01262 TaxID=2903803 RepID=UPI002E36890F|nr:hypothetical protein [Streptomyces sp. NBC_01262]